MPVRLGFLTHLHVGADAADSYAIALDLFAAAEQLGFDSGWVAQHHFLNGGARLPSTLTFLAAAAERTRRIQLGTAIVILPLEDPIRVAEDAAVVDTISGGRLQLGLGTGGDPLSFAAFGRDLDSRRDRFSQGVRVIHDVLGGGAVNGTEARLYPPAATLRDRIWESTLSSAGAARAAANADGLLLARTAFMSTEPTDVAQLPVAQTYLREAARHQADPRDADQAGSAKPAEVPRIGLSRAVYPAADRKTAVAHMADGLADYVNTMIERGFFPPGLSQEEYFSRSHVHYGHPDQVVESLRADLVMPLATELICQVHPGQPTPDQILKALERIASEVAPALGWRNQRTA